MASDPATDNAAEQLILGMTVSEMATLFRAATERAVDEHLAAGRPVCRSYGADRVYAISRSALGLRALRHTVA